MIHPQVCRSAPTQGPPQYRPSVERPYPRLGCQERKANWISCDFLGSKLSCSQVVRANQELVMPCSCSPCAICRSDTAQPRPGCDQSFLTRPDPGCHPPAQFASQYLLRGRAEFRGEGG